MNRGNRPRLSRVSGSSLASRVYSRAGDGSTLSLNFTTGVLDPRVTFTRTTNATFINSQGYVQVADANMFVNSAWTDANNTPTGWTVGTGTGSVSRSNETRTLTCTSQQYWWYQQPASRNGLTYSISVEVTAVSGTVLYGDIILAGSSTTIAWYKDGVLQASGSSTPVTTGIITLIFTANGDNTILRLGLGSAGTNVTGSVTLRYPQFQLGQVPLRSYYENTSTSAARYNSARFDYDPTALTPRGLLIEGSSTNLLARSEDMATIAFPGWGNRQNLTSVTSGFTAPDRNTTAVKIIPNTTAASTHYLGTGTLSVTAQAYTYSCFVKASGYTVVGLVATASQSRASFDLSSLSSAGYGISNTRTITSYPGGWYRISMTWTATVNTPDFWIVVQTTVQDPITGWTGNATDGSIAWGAQVEAGSGASSYIPTGASQGSKANDFAVISGSNFTPWFTGGTSGTFYADWYGGVASAASTVRSVLATTDLTTQHLHMYQISAAGALRVADFNGTNSATTSNSLTSGARTKGAFSFAYPGSGTTSTVNVCLNGGTVASSATMAFSVAPTFLSFGLPSSNGTTTSNADVILNNSIRAIKYWPTVLPNTTLQALTA